METPKQSDRLTAGDPSPQDVAAVSDVLARLITSLEPPEPEILRLRLEGYTREEIALELGLSESRVRTGLDRIRTQLAMILAGQLEI